MFDYPSGHEQHLKKLISGSCRCRVCRCAFPREQVRVTARQEHVWIVSARCGRCRNQQVFWVALKDRVPSDVPDAAELEEAREFAKLPTIRSDDVLDMHEFLETFDGDFQRLFD